MQYFIYVPDKGVIQQSFRTPSEAHDYNNHYHLGGTVISEYQLAELQQDSQSQEQPRNRSGYNLFKRPYVTREVNVSVPVQRYEQQRAPNRTVPYHSFKPHFVKKKRRK